ncbi:hypothetical protein [Paracoccus isoporae]|uniref:hypothetical protein n=1 Tax=Paracoccus isoporae TaxID=591205 RepID=UPI000B888067|nr:hypothetical protein [Paracoccus isoporae]
MLETRDHALHGRIIILSYDEFISAPRLPRASYLFLDIERLSPDQLSDSTARLDFLLAVAPELRILNRPDRVGTRMEVMARLHEAGINGFRLMPAATPAADLLYPVFLRNVQDHSGPRSQLLHSPEELAAALAALPSREGYGITEFVDARNADGLFEKRGYMRVGDSVFASALDASHHWVCKGEYADPATVPQGARELEFLSGDEDGAALRRAFDVARVDYGRADYAIIDGRPQLFEINTNPWLEPPENVPPVARQGALVMIDRFLAGLHRLDRDSGIDAPDWIEVPGARRSTRGFKLNRRSLFRRLLCRLGGLQHETRVMGRLRGLHLL